MRSPAGRGSSRISGLADCNGKSGRKPRSAFGRVPPRQSRCAIEVAPSAPLPAPEVHSCPRSPRSSLSPVSCPGANGNPSLKGERRDYPRRHGYAPDGGRPTSIFFCGGASRSPRSCRRTPAVGFRRFLPRRWPTLSRDDGGSLRLRVGRQARGIRCTVYRAGTAERWGGSGQRRNDLQTHSRSNSRRSRR